MAYAEELDQRVRAMLGETPGLEAKRMFGGVGYLLHGNMACGVHGERLIVRLPAADYEGALSQPHVFVFDLPGRPMKGWITVEPAGVESDAELRAWVERGVQFALGLPPKKG